jgi:hypothetical protein
LTPSPSRQASAALDEELRFHLEERTRDLIGRRLDPNTAASQARRELGAPIRPPTTVKGGDGRIVPVASGA